MSIFKSWLAGTGVLLFLGWSSAALSEHADPIAKPVLDPSLARYAPMASVSGTLKVVGSDTMQPLMSRLATEFRRRHPDAQISVEGGGSDKALREFLANGTPENLIVASSRELTPAEAQQFAAKHGYAPHAVPVAVDAVGIYVHRDNPVSHLTLDQVDAIFSTTRTRGYPHDIARWGQLGLNNGWEQVSIRLYGRNQKSGTRAFVKQHVLNNGEFKSAVHEEPGAASVILALSRDPYGIGYSGIGLLASTVRAVPLAEKEGMPSVEPSITTVADGSYPLRRLLYLYVGRSPRSPLPTVAQEFLAFVNSREGQETVIRAGFYPLPLQQVKQSLAALSR
jgi:phosphate transport system substrate-binding protein